ncbi:MAG: hypothetical protein WKG07_03005 [Hymenobacter sp.]
MRAQAPTPTPASTRLPSGTEYQLFRRDAAGRYQRRPLVVAGDSAYSTRQGRFFAGPHDVSDGPRLRVAEHAPADA